VLTDHLKTETQQVLAHAVEVANAMGHGRIGTEHVLMAMRTYNCNAQRVLQKLGVDDAQKLSEHVVAITPYGMVDSEHPTYTDNVMIAIELAMRAALQDGAWAVSTEHLLLGLVSRHPIKHRNNNTAVQVLELYGYTQTTAESRVRELMQTAS
jgi:ATP-dependent Clp protease ATP-binding subunit ClpA